MQEWDIHYCYKTTNLFFSSCDSNKEAPSIHLILKCHGLVKGFLRTDSFYAFRQTLRMVEELCSTLLGHLQRK